MNLSHITLSSTVCRTVKTYIVDTLHRVDRYQSIPSFPADGRHFNLVAFPKSISFHVTHSLIVPLDPAEIIYLSKVSPTPTSFKRMSSVPLLVHISPLCTAHACRKNARPRVDLSRIPNKHHHRPSSPPCVIDSSVELIAPSRFIEKLQDDLLRSATVFSGNRRLPAVVCLMMSC